ncbi:MAG TPA: hypothetical protein PKE30_01405 [Niabella sp.]|nr:hypothetical protein [Niabella sp.]
MGYDIHITRQENWFDEDESKKISLDEWKDFLLNDAEMRLANFAEATATIRVESDGLAVWTKYSGNGLDGNLAWFDYNKGNIICKNPDNEIINKILIIAKQLDAKVQGDEGELYELTDDKKITTRQLSDSSNYKEKPWWKFW